VGVEQICTRAGVNKGSFYYFFKTKADLVAAAYEMNWRERLPEYERIFAPTVPPLQRLELWCEFMRGVQKKRLRLYGHVCGCPYASVGGELASEDKKIREKARELFDCHVTYLAGAIADAQAAGVATAGDPVAKAQLVHAFIIGLLLRAKIFNDLEVLNLADAAVFALIGATSTLNSRTPKTAPARARK